MGWRGCLPKCLIVSVVTADLVSDTLLDQKAEEEPGNEAWLLH